MADATQDDRGQVGGTPIHQIRRALLPSAVAVVIAASGHARGDVYLGYGLGMSHLSNIVSVGNLSGTEAVELDGVGGRGLELGIVTGYEWELSRVRVSAELDVALSSARSTLSGRFVGYDVSGDVEIDRTVAVAAVAGYEFAGSSQVFGRIGYGTTAYTASLASESFDIDEDTSGEVQGLLLGVGFKLALAGRWSLRCEFTRHLFDDFYEREDMFSWRLEPSIDTTRLVVFRRF